MEKCKNTAEICNIMRKNKTRHVFEAIAGLNIYAKWIISFGKGVNRGIV